MQQQSPIRGRHTIHESISPKPTLCSQHQLSFAISSHGVAVITCKRSWNIWISILWDPVVVVALPGLLHGFVAPLQKGAQRLLPGCDKPWLAANGIESALLVAEGVDKQLWRAIG